MFGSKVAPSHLHDTEEESVLGVEALKIFVTLINFVSFVLTQVKHMDTVRLILDNGESRGEDSTIVVAPLEILDRFVVVGQR